MVVNIHHSMLFMTLKVKVYHSCFRVRKVKMLVDPLEFLDSPTNAVVVSECFFRQD